MAQFIDDLNEELESNEENVNFTDPNIAEAEAEDNDVEEQEEQTEDETEEELPEKYRGKTAQELVQMHIEAEKLVGRQSSEVGDLRKVVDNFIESQAKPTANADAEEEDFDFFDDPDKAVHRAVSNHPSIKAAQEASVQMKQQQVMQSLEANHSDYRAILSDPKFGEWVTKSKIRTELFQRADQQFDYDSADELLSGWKERQGALKTVIKEEKEVINQQRKAASVSKSSGSDNAPSKKIYKRADIRKLLITDPDRYYEMASEIEAAYSEGRVR